MRSPKLHVEFQSADSEKHTSACEVWPGRVGLAADTAALTAHSVLRIALALAVSAASGGTLQEQYLSQSILESPSCASLSPSRGSLSLMGKRGPPAPDSAPKSSKRPTPLVERPKRDGKRSGGAGRAADRSAGHDRSAAARLELVLNWMKREGFKWDESALLFQTEPEAAGSAQKWAGTGAAAEGGLKVAQRSRELHALPIPKALIRRPPRPDRCEARPARGRGSRRDPQTRRAVGPQRPARRRAPRGVRHRRPGRHRHRHRGRCRTDRTDLCAAQRSTA